jgi:hypothetical protein
MIDHQHWHRSLAGLKLEADEKLCDRQGGEPYIPNTPFSRELTRPVRTTSLLPMVHRGGDDHFNLPTATLESELNAVRSR